MNIVFIVSDTLRRDRVGCYGNEWIRTPHLDRFAKQCVIFDRCYEASFPTMPTRADWFTGKFTFTYLGWAPLPPDELTLPALLRQVSYTTSAVVDTPFFVRNGYGYDRGFQDFRWVRGQGAERSDVNYERRYEEDYCAPMTVSHAERWLERHHKERFFLYVDTWDPHEPWDPPPYYVELYLKGYDGRVVAPCYGPFKERGLTAQDVRIAHACYCGEVTMVDRWVGRLIDRIESLGLMDKTAVIFVADHGFYFGEHGQFGKAVRGGAEGVGQFVRSPLYDEVARVPLLVYVPGVKPRRSDALVSQPDLMPTVLELAGVEIPDAVQGRSLVRLLKGKQERGREFVVTTWPLYNPGDITRAVDAFERRVAEPLPSTITDGEWTLLYAMEGERVEMYHVASDPQQKRNLFRQNRKVAEGLHQKFVTLLEELGTEERLLSPRRRLR